jgi:hypothetical protein
LRARGRRSRAKEKKRRIEEDLAELEGRDLKGEEAGKKRKYHWDIIQKDWKEYDEAVADKRKDEEKRIEDEKLLCDKEDAESKAANQRRADEDLKNLQDDLELRNKRRHLYQLSIERLHSERVSTDEPQRSRPPRGRAGGSSSQTHHSDNQSSREPENQSNDDTGAGQLQDDDFHSHSSYTQDNKQYPLGPRLRGGGDSDSDDESFDDDSSGDHEWQKLQEKLELKVLLDRRLDQDRIRKEENRERKEEDRRRLRAMAESCCRQEGFGTWQEE